MDLKYGLEAAEEFGEIIWPIRRELRIHGLMLYGSIARAEPNPTDVDLFVMHRSQKLDWFQDKLKSEEFQSDAGAFKSLEGMLGINLTKLFSQSKIRILISQGLLHTSYVNEFYFTDQNYRERWDQQNENPNFFKNAISNGFLWNPQSKKYDISAKTRYHVPRLITSPQN